MKVILQQDVKGQGKKGQMVEVSDGYGRNFLLPRKLAVEATAENVNTMRMQDKAKQARLAEEKAQAQALAGRLKGVQVQIRARAGQGGKLFGSITSKEISEELKAQFGLDVGKSKIVLSDPIKSFGAFDVKCKLGSEVSGEIHVLAIEDKSPGQKREGTPRPPPLDPQAGPVHHRADPGAVHAHRAGGGLFPAGAAAPPRLPPVGGDGPDPLQILAVPPVRQNPAQDGQNL